MSDPPTTDQLTLLHHTHVVMAILFLEGNSKTCNADGEWIPQELTICKGQFQVVPKSCKFCLMKMILIPPIFQ